MLLHAQRLSWELHTRVLMQIDLLSHCQQPPSHLATDTTQAAADQMNDYEQRIIVVETQASLSGASWAQQLTSGSKKLHPAELHSRDRLKLTYGYISPSPASIKMVLAAGAACHGNRHFAAAHPLRCHCLLCRHSTSQCLHSEPNKFSYAAVQSHAVK